VVSVQEQRAKARRNMLIAAAVAIAVLGWMVVSSSDRYDWTPLVIVAAFFVGIWAARS
jgi:uncharacterized membrane protein